MSRRYLARTAIISLLGLIIGLSPGLLAGCSLKSKRTIKIVTSFPMRGVALGRSAVNAVQLALGEQGAQLAGFSVELVILDDGTDVERAGTNDRKAILNAMSTLGEMEGVAGRFTFDINGDTTITTISGNIVRNGTFEYLQTLAP